MLKHTVHTHELIQQHPKQFFHIPDQKVACEKNRHETASLRFAMHLQLEGSFPLGIWLS